jgi:deoxycytidylate deaminase
MYYNLGACIVKGGKILSTGYNHQRPHYDGNEITTRGYRKPVSMHAEMHVIFNITGMSPSFQMQLQGSDRRQLWYETRRPDAAKTGWCLSRAKASCSEVAQAAIA